jgi:peptidyl-prolyl cis-trans isomerase D
MLSTIREKIQGIFATVIIAMIVIPFALWGVNQYFEGDSKVTVAEVNGTEISHDDLQRQLDRYRGRVNPKMLETPFFKQQILNQMIQRILLQQAVQNGGYGVSREQLGALIRAMPEFQVDGTFNSARYEDLLRRSGQTYQGFEDSMRHQKMLDQLISGLKGSGFVTKQDEDRVLALAQQRRRIAVVTVSVDQLENGIKVSEKDLEDYYQAHQDQYRVPEQVRIAYIELSAKSVAATIKPTEADLKATYESEKSRFMTPPERRVSHILIPLSDSASPADVQKALKKAQDIARQAKAGANFASLARKYSGDSSTASRGGDLGTLSPGLLPKNLEAAIETLKQGGVTAPIRTRFGYHVAKVTQYKAGKVKSYAQVRQQLIALVKKEKGTRRYYDEVEKFNNIVYEQSDSLEPAAKALGLKVHTSDWFARTGGKGITANPKVTGAAFSSDVLLDKHNSDSLEIGKDSLLALRVVDHKAATVKPFASVRKEIVANLRKDRAQQEATRLGSEILTRARKSGSLEQAARGVAAARYHKPVVLTRYDTKATDPAVLQAAFAAPRPRDKKESLVNASLKDKGYAVIAVTAVMDGKASDLDKKKAKELQNALQARRGDDYFNDFISGLRKQAKIEIHEKAL